MVVVDRSYAGAAAATIINTAMTATVPGVGGTITVADDSGYPSSGKFEIVVDRGLPNEENILISSRSGTTFTIGQRGYDGSVASSHDSGAATCEADLSGRSVQLFVDHVDDVESDPHSTKLLNNARHDLEARHTFGAALGTPVTPTALTPDIAGAAGTGNNPAREDHVHNVPAGTPVAVGTALAESATADFARAGHVHTVGVGAINNANMFAASVVDAAALADNAVDTNAIQAGAVTGPKLGDTFTMQVFTSSGTWNKPAGLRYVRVRVVGGGGSGGGVEATTAAQVAESGGGGGGGYSEEVIPAASLGATVAVTVGAGGAAAAAGNNPGNAGGSSGFGAFLTATGGSGGAGGPATASGTGFNMALGGAGGAGSAGDINLTGERGGRGILHFTSGGTGYLHRSCEGGGSALAGRTTMNTTSATSGVAGQNYGGGSTGAENGASQSARASTPGADGIVIVEEYR